MTEEHKAILAMLALVILVGGLIVYVVILVGNALPDDSPYARLRRDAKHRAREFRRQRRAEFFKRLRKIFR